MRIGEASMVLGIPQHRLREWSNRGLINSQRKGKDEDRYYHSDEIAKATALTAPTHPGMMPTDKLPDGYVVLSAAAKTLNVAYWDLTRLATSTPWNEGPLPYQKKGGGTRGMYIVSEANLAKIAPEWLDSCSRDRIRMAEAVRYTGLGPSVLGRAIIRGELKCAITAGKCRFRYSELDQWMSDRGRLHKMLIPKHAAEAAGVSAETLSAAVKKGELNAEHTCGGHARFNLDEVLKWASKRP
jgi:excisionase family DNA binding protein